MKILYLIGSLGNGGKERLVRDVLEMHDQRPYEAWCVSRKGPAEDNGVIYLPSKKIIHFLLGLRKIVRTKEIELVHAQSAFDALLAVLATVGLRTRVIETFHSYEFATKRHMKMLESLAFAMCARSVFVSRQQMEHFAEVHHLSAKQRQKQALVYNGVNFDRFGLRPHQPNERPKMAMVGNFVPEKDQLFVCRFLEELRERGYGFDFYFIGERKPQYTACYDRCVAYCEEKKLTEQVHFMGRRDDVPELLGEMDAFVYCSKSETFGLAVVEAIAMGLPTFVNDLPVFEEITQGGRLATLYSAEETAGLCEKFADYMAHREDYLTAAARNAQSVRDNYSILAHVANLNSLYSQII